MSKLEYFKQRIETSFSPVDYIRADKARPGAMMLLDVRNAPVDKLGTRIAGAVLMPQAEIAGRLSELPRDKTMVVYGWDAACNLGSRAAVTLLENGYDVMELNGGFAAWNSMGLPTEEIV